MTSPIFETLNFDPNSFTTREEYKPLFRDITTYLMNSVAIHAGDSVYRIAELEIYYSGGAHIDTFTHCDPYQQSCGEWYFHRKGKTYKSGSYKGLDITFGEANVLFIEGLLMFRMVLVVFLFVLSVIQMDLILYLVLL
eukprot:TRINITY_DN6586_c0_g1_i1.p1 TRINITY_DN6586_c0_g1~~TRINITY_DN6586_c0_g1_i1.p1  ORF type:complete len:160 (-),score=26.54 TRINITY_DN6586_c0_g1_i1:415-828(-)